MTGGATLLAQPGGGPYWLPPGALGPTGFGPVSAWVPAVQILR